MRARAGRVSHVGTQPLFPTLAKLAKRHSPRWLLSTVSVRNTSMVPGVARINTFFRVTVNTDPAAGWTALGASTTTGFTFTHCSSPCSYSSCFLATGLTNYRSHSRPAREFPADVSIGRPLHPDGGTARRSRLPGDDRQSRIRRPAGEDLRPHSTHLQRSRRLARNNCILACCTHSELNFHCRKTQQCGVFRSLGGGLRSGARRASAGEGRNVRKRNKRAGASCRS